MTALETIAVTKSFGGVAALSEVSMTLEAGAVQGLVGPNGCGKTTLLNVFNGFTRPDAGAVTLDGLKITTLSVQSRARSGVARTFQTPRVVGDLTALENVMLGAWPAQSTGYLSGAFGLPGSLREDRRTREDALRLLDGVGLGAVADWSSDRLDHGQRRFLEIARALIGKPRFILMDEPAGGLTHVEIDRLGSVIEAVAESRVGVLLVEHHTDFVFELCHRVTALNLGRVLVDGAPADVRRNEDLARVYLGD